MTDEQVVLVRKGGERLRGRAHVDQLNVGVGLVTALQEGIAAQGDHDAQLSAREVGTSRGQISWRWIRPVSTSQTARAVTGAD